jgi:hypothetical protein
MMDRIGVAGHSGNQRGNGEGIRLGRGKGEGFPEEIGSKRFDHVFGKKRDAPVGVNISNYGDQSTKDHETPEQKNGQEVFFAAPGCNFIKNKAQKIGDHKVH